MKKARSVSHVQFDISNKKSLKQLQKRAKFTYVDMYQGKEGRKYAAITKQRKFHDLLEKLSHPPLKIAEIAILGKNGFGAVATDDIPLLKGNKDVPLGIYWGKLEKEGKEGSSYIFTLSKHEIDACKYGNWTRFVNHSKNNYNVIAKQKTLVCGKNRLSYIEYALNKPVKAGQQLLVDYGPNYEFDRKHQIFLNPSNGVLSSNELFSRFQDVYEPVKGRLLDVCKKLIPHADKLFAPAHYMQILQGKAIYSATAKKHIPVELPVLVAAKNGSIGVDSKQAGVTALMLAAYIGNPSATSMLIKKYRANVEQQNIRTGHTALFYAVQGDATPTAKANIVKQLIDKGIDLTTQDRDGNTILHWCVLNKDLASLKFLFTYSKSKHEAFDVIEIHNRDEFDPITCAIANGEYKIASYLMQIFTKHFNSSVFDRRHNEWLLPIVKKIMRKTPVSSLKKTIKFLLENGVDQNQAARKVLLQYANE